MELHLIDTIVPGYADPVRLTKKTQISMESVVPDTREDIGRILSVCPQLCLKSKETNGRGAAVGGELSLTVLYINETADGVASIGMTQPFTVEFEHPACGDETAIQLRWRIESIQVRTVNPRKVAAELELSAELSLYNRDKLPVSQALPEDAGVPIHLLTGERSVERTVCVCERSFSVSEQLAFPEGAPAPKEIVASESAFRIREKELVGSRLLVKGTVVCDLLYMPADAKTPAEQSFALPFSLLMDTGEEETKDAEVWIEKTSAYCDLIETIEGQPMLNLELHALAQARAFREETVRFVADAYCNAMPCECVYEEQSLRESAAVISEELTAEECVDLPEEFEELLGLYACVGPFSADKCEATADLLCRSREGTLFGMKRKLCLGSGQEGRPASPLSLRITEKKTRVEGKKLTVGLCARAEERDEKTVSFRRVVDLELDEEKLFDTSAFPSLTAVWPQNETVWELAKFYHSSPEAIRALNEEDARPVFIPKSE